MKIYIRLLCVSSIFFHYNLLLGQRGAITSCTDIFALCHTDFSKPIPGLKIDSLAGNNAIVYGKNSIASLNYMDVLYAKDPHRSCDTLNHSKTYCLNDPEMLTYNVFYPDSLFKWKIKCPMPVIILFHGGGFHECPSHDNLGILSLSRELAKRGFVVFDAEYRAGVMNDPRIAKTGYNYVSVQQILGIYRALQDARGAIRSIIYRQRINDNGADFRIDTNRIFLGGMSAGSLMAMNAAYYEKQWQTDTVYENPGTVLGDIDASFYVGDTTISYFSKIKGVLNLWGSFGVPVNLWNDPAAFISRNTYTPPLISFHGAKDPIFYIGRQFTYNSADSLGDRFRFNFNTERNCLVRGSSFSLDKDADSPDAVSLGADPLYAMFKFKGIATEEYVDTDMGHGLDECDTCRDNSYFKSDFGTGFTNADSVYAYIAGRTATFFTAAMFNIADNLTTTRFVDCENKRIKCNVTDNSACTPIAVNQLFRPKHARAKSL